MSKADGGPAFPVRDSDHAACVAKEACRVSPGMSLRDYIAARIVSSDCRMLMAYDAKVMSALSAKAYEFADAMLKERVR